MCGCGKKKPDNSLNAENLRSRGVNNQLVVKDVTSGNDFVPAIYNGPDYPHYIPSSTGIIAQYGILNYGMGKNGDRINVHRNDLEKSRGRLYLPVQEEGELEMANKGNEGIRGSEKVDPNIFSAEEETNKRLNAQAAKKANAEAQEEAAPQNNLVALAKNGGKTIDAESTEALAKVDGDAVEAKLNEAPKPAHHAAKAASKPAVKTESK